MSDLEKNVEFIANFLSDKQADEDREFCEKMRAEKYAKMHNTAYALAFNVAEAAYKKANSGYAWDAKFWDAYKKEVYDNFAYEKLAYEKASNLVKLARKQVLEKLSITESFWNNAKAEKEKAKKEHSSAVTIAEQAYNKYIVANARLEAFTVWDVYRQKVIKHMLIDAEHKANEKAEAELEKAEAKQAKANERAKKKAETEKEKAKAKKLIAEAVAKAIAKTIKGGTKKVVAKAKKKKENAQNPDVVADTLPKGGTKKVVAKAKKKKENAQNPDVVADTLPDTDTSWSRFFKETPSDSPSGGSVQKTGEVIANELGMEFAWIPAGTFMMGSPESEEGRSDNEIHHKVTITKGFYLGIFTVTQEQRQTIMGENPNNNKDAKLPYSDVSWEDCQEFIKKLNEKTKGGYRLPTEAEWEYACRAGTTTRFSFGEWLTPKDANCYDSKIGKPVAVGSYKANAFGLYDMHGNVFEWCEDWRGAYSEGRVIDPKGPKTGEHRVLRGGSFLFSNSSARSSNRYYFKPSDRVNYFGFRLARTP
jgi:sulfatase modifying factor 1